MEPAAFACLIRTAFDPRADSEQRNLAGRALQDYLTGLARHVARGNPNLTQELMDHVFVQCARGKYEPRENTTPEAWVLTVMRNYRVDVGKRMLRTGVGDTLLPEEPDLGDRPLSRDMNIDLTARFCPQDDARVAVWTPRQRIILLPWWLLWRKAETSRWSDTVRAARLLEPFPRPGFERLDAPDRTIYLAEALALTANAIDQALKRGRKRVFALRFMQELAVPG
jgi:hypothetical protein